MNSPFPGIDPYLEAQGLCGSPRPAAPDDPAPAQGRGLLIGDAIAVDRNGTSRRVEAEFLE